ncbi:MAG: DUF367 domain-containing protein [Candidatus Lokiarchaeota archaeon]|nr:DUF367 domain-containing protein [Candidatus Lokiarchaeota archaeon]
MSNLERKKNWPKIYCLHLRNCDPSKCTAIRLQKFSILKIIKKISGRLKNAVVLYPLSHNLLTKNDQNIIKKHGIIVIDCSWKRIFDATTIDLKGFVNDRKLPPLRAVNSINYGKWEKLSSAEALAAALFITNYKDFSKFILSKFPWGDEFFRINF